MRNHGGCDELCETPVLGHAYMSEFTCWFIGWLGLEETFVWSLTWQWFVVGNSACQICQ